MINKIKCWFGFHTWAWRHAETAHGMREGDCCRCCGTWSPDSVVTIYSDDRPELIRLRAYRKKHEAFKQGLYLRLGCGSMSRVYEEIDRLKK